MSCQYPKFHDTPKARVESWLSRQPKKGVESATRTAVAWSDGAQEERDAACNAEFYAEKEMERWAGIASDPNIYGTKEQRLAAQLVDAWIDARDAAKMVINIWEGAWAALAAEYEALKEFEEKKDAK